MIARHRSFVSRCRVARSGAETPGVPHAFAMDGKFLGRLLVTVGNGVEFSPQTESGEVPGAIEIGPGGSPGVSQTDRIATRGWREPSRAKKIAIGGWREGPEAIEFVAGRFRGALGRAPTRIVRAAGAHSRGFGVEGEDAQTRKSAIRNVTSGKATGERVALRSWRVTEPHPSVEGSRCTSTVLAWTFTIQYSSTWETA